MAADDAVLEGVKGAEVIDFSGALVPCQEGTRPEIDEIVSERALYSVRQAVAGLPQQIDDIGDGRDRDEGARGLVDQIRRRNRGAPAQQRRCAKLPRAHQAIEPDHGPIRANFALRSGKKLMLAAFGPHRGRRFSEPAIVI